MSEIQTAEHFARQHHIPDGCVAPLEQWGEAHREMAYERGLRDGRDGVVLHPAGPAPPPEQPSSLVEQCQPFLDDAMLPLELRLGAVFRRVLPAIDALTARFDALEANVDSISDDVVEHLAAPQPGA